MVLFVLKIFFWIFLILVSFLVFWRTLTPLNVQVWLLDWYYLVTWLRWPDGSAETAVFWSPAWEAGLSVGFCWLSQKPLARAECVFVPGTVCKRQAVLNMLLQSDSGCVWLKLMVFQLRGQNVSFAMKKDHSGRCWRFWDDFRAWISVIIYSTSICFKPGLLPSNFKWNILLKWPINKWHKNAFKLVNVTCVLYIMYSETTIMIIAKNCQILN